MSIIQINASVISARQLNIIKSELQELGFDPTSTDIVRIKRHLDSQTYETKLLIPAIRLIFDNRVSIPLALADIVVANLPTAVHLVNQKLIEAERLGLIN